MHNPEDSINTVLEYLQHEFPGSAVTHRYDFNSRGEFFQVSLAGTVYILYVSHEVLNDFSTQEIHWRLQNWHVSEQMRTSPDGQIDFHRQRTMVALKHPFESI